MNEKALYILAILLGFYCNYCNGENADGPPPNPFTGISSANDQRSKDISDHYHYVLNNLARSTGDVQQQQIHAGANKNLGDFYFSQNNFEKAVDYYLESLRMFTVLENENEIAALSKNAGEAYFGSGKLDMALEYFLASLEKYKTLEQAEEIKFLNIALANTYYDKGEYALCVNYMEEFLPGIRGQEGFNTASMLYKYGYCLKELGKSTQAIGYFQESLILFQALKRPEWELLNHIRLGELFIESGRAREALLHLDTGKGIAEKENYKLHLRQVYLLSSNALEQGGNYSAAFNELRNYSMLNDSLFNTEKETQLRDIYELNETERIDREITVLSQEKKHHRQLIRTQWVLIFGIVAGVAIITIFVLILFKQNEKQKKTNLDLVRKNLELVENEKNDLQEIVNLEEELNQKVEKYKPLQDKASQHISALNLELSLLAREGLLNENQTLYSTIQQQGEKIQQLLSGLDLPENHNNTGRPGKASVGLNGDGDLLVAILTIMERTKLFLEEGFTLDKLSSLVGSNKREVSNLINEEFGQGFNTFINNYRIKEARKMLADVEYQHYTIEAVANTVGFKSKSSFNFYFKRFTGLTPSYFKNTVMLTSYIAMDSINDQE